MSLTIFCWLKIFILLPLPLFFRTVFLLLFLVLGTTPSLNYLWHSQVFYNTLLHFWNNTLALHGICCWLASVSRWPSWYLGHWCGMVSDLLQRSIDIMERGLGFLQAVDRCGLLYPSHLWGVFPDQVQCPFTETRKKERKKCISTRK